jgi:hypothetical protein
MSGAVPRNRTVVSAVSTAGIAYGRFTQTRRTLSKKLGVGHLWLSKAGDVPNTNRSFHNAADAGFAGIGSQASSAGQMIRSEVVMAAAGGRTSGREWS